MRALPSGLPVGLGGRDHALPADRGRPGLDFEPFQLHVMALDAPRTSKILAVSSRFEPFLASRVPVCLYVRQ